MRDTTSADSVGLCSKFVGEAVESSLPVSDAVVKSHGSESKDRVHNLYKVSAIDRS